jgi:hypothetical protein
MQMSAELEAYEAYVKIRSDYFTFLEAANEFMSSHIKELEKQSQMAEEKVPEVMKYLNADMWKDGYVIFKLADVLREVADGMSSAGVSYAGPVMDMTEISDYIIQFLRPCKSFKVEEEEEEDTIILFDSNIKLYTTNKIKGESNRSFISVEECFDKEAYTKTMLDAYQNVIHLGSMYCMRYGGKLDKLIYIYYDVAVRGGDHSIQTAHTDADVCWDNFSAPTKDNTVEGKYSTQVSGMVGFQKSYLYVWKGSHQIDTAVLNDKSKLPISIVRSKVKFGQGECLLWLGNLIHAGGDFQKPNLRSHFYFHGMKQRKDWYLNHPGPNPTSTNRAVSVKSNSGASSSYYFAIHNEEVLNRLIDHNVILQSGDRKRKKILSS